LAFVTFKIDVVGLRLDWLKALTQGGLEPNAKDKNQSSKFLILCSRF